MKVEVDYKKMGNNLKSILDERNITINAYAESINITPKLAMDYINGNKIMSLEIIIETANLLEISIDSLISYKIID